MAKKKSDDEVVEEVMQEAALTTPNTVLAAIISGCTKLTPALGASEAMSPLTLQLHSANALYLIGMALANIAREMERENAIRKMRR